MTIRDKFVEKFSEEEACKIEEAANSHFNGVNDQNKGTDPFKWVLLMGIGYQCMEVKSFREWHTIITPWDELKQWIKDEADLGTHDGDYDFLSLLAGVYDEYAGKEEQTDVGK